ncbi:hypothetical protein [Zavarzinia sp. CC-PAN008]|uniref:hypothetical protein n=1 Tax=Zavarzinia sp. CC-PAN008 TaxID=3243332 RepID=UPI003F745416
MPRPVLLRPLLGLLALGLASVPAAADGPAPIVAVSPSGKACLMGGIRDGRVLDAATMKPLLQGGEAYRVLDLYNGPVAATGSRAVDEDICTDVVALSPDFDQVAWVAIGGTWPPVPRPVMSQDPDQPVYVQAVLDWLKAQGIPAARTTLSQVLRLDIEGDGTDEVLLTAEYYVPGESVLGVTAGDHAVVLMRRIAKGKIETVRVTGTAHAATDPDGLREHYRVSALADVDGDGVPEAVIHSLYHEGEGTDAYRLNGSAPEFIMGCGCGL